MTGHIEKPPGSLVSNRKLMRSAALLARMDEERINFGERLRSDEAREALRR